MHVCGTHVSLVFQISIIVILRLSTLILEKKSSFCFLSRDWVVITSFEDPSLALPSGWFLESAVMGKAKEGNKAETLSLCQHELFMSQVLPKKGFWGRLKFLDNSGSQSSLSLCYQNPFNTSLFMGRGGATLGS